MISRDDINSIFSSFIEFQDGDFFRWQEDRRLMRSMSFLASNEELEKRSKRSISIYWHHIYASSKSIISQQHLLALLQESCYWSAYKISSNFRSTQFSLADYFQVAISKIESVLNKFDSNKGVSLESYSSRLFHSYIKDYLRKTQEVDICTDWLLLRKSSRKQIKEALEASGLDSESILKRRLAVMCFKQVYATEVNQQLDNQNSSQVMDLFLQTEDLFRREEITHLGKRSKNITPQLIETWLRDTAKYIRSYLCPKLSSLNASRPGYEDSEIVETIASQDALQMDKLVELEERDIRSRERQQLVSVIKSCFSSLDSEEKVLLDLYYKQGIKQLDISSQLSLPQYKVSRKLSRIRKKFVIELVKWKEEMTGHPTDIELVQVLGQIVEEFLEARYDSFG